MTDLRSTNHSSNVDVHQPHTNGSRDPAAEIVLGALECRRDLPPLIGRETTLHELERLLQDPATRHLTLTGTGGSGKTRLALQVASNSVSAFPDGIIVVSLAPIAHATLVVPTIARVLGIHEGETGQLDQRVAATLRDARSLLLLDNFEHVLEAAPFVSWLVQMCPRLVVLVTSRERLRTQGEREHLIPPLDLVSSSGNQDGQTHSEAALLFIERMNAIGAAGPSSETERTAIEGICQRLDGLPLAIELAAAWSRVLRPPALLDRLEPKLPMLIGGKRDAPARQRTMRATIQWSYDLLNPDEQALFRVLAVFRGGFTLASVEAIVENEAPPNLHGRVLDIIAGLVDKCLLAPVVAFGGEPRFTMLETVREFAMNRLDAAGETSVCQERHCRHFVQVARQIGPFLQWQQDTQRSIARLDEDQDNFRSALAWAFDHDRHHAFLDLVSALEPYWALRGKLQEGRRWLEIALPISDDAPLPKRANTVRACAWNARYLGDYRRADALGQQAFELAEKAGDRYGVLHSLTGLGLSAGEQGNYSTALSIFETVRAGAQDLGNRSWEAWATRNIGRAAHDLQEFDTAQHMNEQSIVLFQEADCHHGVTEAQTGLALLAMQRGDYGQAADCWCKRMGPGWDEMGTRTALEGLVDVSIACHRYELAARLLGAAEAQRDRLGVPIWPVVQTQYEASLESVRSALGPVGFQVAWDDGWQCSAQEARELVRASAGYLADAARRTAPVVSNRYRLTRRELDVLELVAAERTNRQIADALFISVPTVKRHLTTAYGKLGVDSRAEAVAVLFGNSN